MGSINFKQLRQDAKMILEGEFVAAIVESSAVTNSKGNPMIKTKWKIITGPYEGRPIYNNFNVTPESPGGLKMFFRHMDILGLGDEFFDTDPEPEDIATAIIGRTATLKIGKRTYMGADQENVEGISPAPAGFGSALPTSAPAGALLTALPTGRPTALPTALPKTPAGAAPAVASGAESAAATESAAPVLNLGDDAPEF